jgi:hypothetical protein
MNNPGMSRAIFVTISALVSATAFAESSLCRSQETTYFNCTVGKKLVSLCASRDLSAKSGTLQYRFGLPSKPPELEYPKTPDLAAKHFTEYDSWFAKGGTQALGFSIGSYSYSIYETHSAFGYNGAGVIISKAGVRTQLLECQHAKMDGGTFYSEASKLGLPKADLDNIGPEQ